MPPLVFALDHSRNLPEVLSSMDWSIKEAKLFQIRSEWESPVHRAQLRSRAIRRPVGETANHNGVAVA
jgi:hypothetical protein